MGWKRYAGLWGVALALLLFWACEDGRPPTSDTTGTGGGGCPMGPPRALFTLKVHAADGPLPPDTTVHVKWTAGDEPPFVLSDKDTWKTVEDGSNVECDVDHDAPVPTDLHELRCELWTNSATEIEVTAMGYVPVEQTALPMERDGCDEPVPSEVEVELAVDTDAGAR